MSAAPGPDALAAFDAWQDAEPEAREVVLAALLAALPEAARARLQALIAADQAAEAQGFLARPAALPASDAALAGQRLGAWTLTAPLGQGGMGAVWRARRSDGAHQGEAAIKLLHSPWRGAAARARFRREGELLARLTHPHIAQLMDVGEALIGATPTRYLVLELVPGERIDHWCSSRALAVPARLRLFLQACDAVAHAHTRLVVHRDLKPGNILVTGEGEGEGQVKLLDFGVAKLIAEGTDAELTREAAAGLTPEYAAPEQLRGEPVSTATDVFALGRLLCLLLTGQREPGPTLRGELALIVARALKPRPEARYPGAAALADDLRRHLAHQPIQARADSLAYRSAKFARRYRLQLVALGLVLAVLSAGIAATAWQWRQAVQEAERTRRVQAVFTELLGAFSPEVSGRSDVPLTALLRRSWAEARQRLADDPALLGAVAKPLGQLLTQAGDMGLAAEALALAHQRAPDDDEVMLQLAHVRRRLGQAAQAQALFEAVASRGGGAAAVSAQIALGDLAREAGDLDRARALLTRAEARARQQLGRQHEAYRRACDALADLARAAGRWGEARHWLQALSEASAGQPLLTALASMSAATFEAELGRHAQAVPLLRASVAELTTVLGADHVHTVFTRAWLAQALHHHGQPAAALAEADAAADAATRVVEPDAAPRLALVRAQLRLHNGLPAAAPRDLAARLTQAGAADAVSRLRLVEAETLLRQGRPREAQALLAGLAATPASWQALALHGLSLQALGQADAALAQLVQAGQAADAALPEAHPGRQRARLLWRQAQAQPSAGELAADIDALASPRADAAALRQRLAGLLLSGQPRSIDFGLAVLSL